MTKEIERIAKELYVAYWGKEYFWEALNKKSKIWDNWKVVATEVKRRELRARIDAHKESLTTNEYIAHPIDVLKRVSGGFAFPTKEQNEFHQKRIAELQKELDNT